MVGRNAFTLINNGKLLDIVRANPRALEDLHRYKSGSRSMVGLGPNGKGRRAERAPGQTGATSP